MKTKTKTLSLAFAGAFGIAAFGGTAFADHEHFLVTPGTCVENIAHGQTAISDSEHGGYHRFHYNVHTGVPGNGPLNKAGQAPVIVDKTSGGDAGNLVACEAALED